MGTLCHVLGSGNAMDPGNHIFRERLNACLHGGLVPTSDGIVVYGRQQPGSDVSEATTGLLYLRTQAEAARVTLPQMVADETPKSTSETMGRIAGRIFHQINNPLVRHNVVTNWIYVPRTRYLLRKRWERDHPGIPWAKIEHLVDFVGVGGTFVPYRRQRGFFRALIHWGWALAREAGAWGKAFGDPYDQRLNQDREWSKIF